MNHETLVSLALEKMSLAQGQRDLIDFRQTHLELFKQKNILREPETYKFTNLNSYFSNFEITPHESKIENIDSYLDESFINFIFINGELKNTPESFPGLKFSTIAESFAKLASDFKQTNPLSHLHHALCSNGVVIEVEKNTHILKPIRFVQLITRSDIYAPTIVIKMGQGSRASLIEEHNVCQTQFAQIQECMIELKGQAYLEHVQLTELGQESIVHHTISAEVHQDATYRQVLLNLGAKLNRCNLTLDLLNPGAHGENYSLYLTNGNEHSDINTLINHKAPDTTSDQLAKGILDGHSKAIFTGKIYIHPQAQRVSSGQLNKNLLLSNKAQAHSQPQLEIFADDVKCSHGSTTGQLSPDEIFYFQARGIPEQKAKTLLAHGLGLEIVLKIQNPLLVKKVEEKVLQTLKTKFHLGGSL